MKSDIEERLLAALELPHRRGMIGGDLREQVAFCASYQSVMDPVLDALGSEDRCFRAVDLGTGGGLPGLVLAMLYPVSEWLLIEMRTNRAAEVERASLRLGVSDRVTVLAMEAQVVAHGEDREQADVVVARSFGPPSLVAECGSGLLRIGGSLMVSEPPETTEDRWPTTGLKSLGLSFERSESVDGATFAVMTKKQPLGLTIPRLPVRKGRDWPS